MQVLGLPLITCNFLRPRAPGRCVGTCNNGRGCKHTGDGQGKSHDALLAASNLLVSLVEQHKHRVVHIKRAQYDVYIGRASAGKPANADPDCPWGIPFQPMMQSIRITLACKHAPCSICVGCLAINTWWLRHRPGLAAKCLAAGVHPDTVMAGYLLLWRTALKRSANCCAQRSPMFTSLVFLMPLVKYVQTRQRTAKTGMAKAKAKTEPKAKAKGKRKENRDVTELEKAKGRVKDRMIG
eukprot:TRINITY_DN104100_c0_g1_i1.p1 TRINITY_DN104100_c0_g1~~TRINITY_DN104100_c0_g1_i1.p1  ORF type:complete len:239 (-),score=23.69 TRINITY_DN104100_c0_g1_i1:226-942(-)